MASFLAPLMRMLQVYKLFLFILTVMSSYLALRPSDVNDTDTLEELWERAVTLASKFVPERAAVIATTVAKRLVPLGRHEAAAELYVELCSRFVSKLSSNRMND